MMMMPTVMVSMMVMVMMMTTIIIVVIITTTIITILTVMSFCFQHWPHAQVWFVVLVVEKAVAAAQGAFAVRRVQWLRSMPAPRSRTRNK